VNVKRAILSVSDKTGLEHFARKLAKQDVEFIASGNTAAALRDAGLAVREVSDATGSPEIMDGRVKTLHPATHGGILSRRTFDDRKQLAEVGGDEIDLVVVNLYPFEETVARPDVSLESAIEQIDIGGVTLLQAAAKNFAHVAVVCHPADYEVVLTELEAHGRVTPETRRRLAIKAFARTAAYDATIRDYLAAQE
jgi:phosphoribosylaminoimidazolecarboxamide formyltransferase/IMP cyclohydrolase